MTSPSPVDVVREALLQPVPCPSCGRQVACRCMPQPDKRLDWQANLIVQALNSQGLLVVDAPATTPEAIEEIAHWLATESRHPRYVGVEDGWRKLLESEADIHVAHRAAVDTHSGDRELEKTLARARDELLRHVTNRRAARTEG